MNWKIKQRRDERIEKTVLITEFARTQFSPSTDRRQDKKKNPFHFGFEKNPPQQQLKRQAKKITPKTDFTISKKGGKN